MQHFKNCRQANEVAVTPDMLRAWLGVAAEAARQAGDFLVQTRTSEPVVISQVDRDVKLAADLESEERIIQILGDKSDLTILSEEQGTVEGKNALQTLRWIVDPLDGSFNYLKGIPFCCVSVGLWDMDEPLLGVVYDFWHGEMFTGIVGIGAWLNGSPIHVGNTQEPKQALLSTGFPVYTDFSTHALIGFAEKVCQYKKVRLLGSAALSLVYVAASRTDAYCEQNINIWDVAAGLAIVRAAGGQIAWMMSARPHTLTVYAGNFSLPRPTL